MAAGKEGLPPGLGPGSASNSNYYNQPIACQAEREKHDVCFHKWLASNIDSDGEAGDKEVNCEVEWNTYQGCVTKKLSALGLSNLQRDWKPPKWEDLDQVDRNGKKTVVKVDD